MRKGFRELLKGQRNHHLQALQSQQEHAPTAEFSLYSPATGTNPNVILCDVHTSTENFTTNNTNLGNSANVLDDVSALETQEITEYESEENFSENILTMLMKYYVILYENYCITVPSSWVDIDQLIFRMPKGHEKLRQACLKQISPSDDWNEVAFKRKFGPFDSYKHACDVEKAVSEFLASDDNLILPENNSKKRLIRKRNFLGDMSSEEDDRKRSKVLSIPSNFVPQVESEHSIKSQSQQSKSICLPVSQFQNLDDLEDDRSDRSENMTYSSEEEKETLENSHYPQAMKGKSKVHSRVISNIRTQPRLSFKNDTRNNCEPDPLAELGEHYDCIENHRSCFDTFQREVMQKFAMIERKLDFIAQFIQNLGQTEPNPMIQIKDYSLLPNFPLTTVEQLKDFDIQLRNIAVRQQFIQKMSKIGGENATKTVRNIMFECIGHKVAQVYTWTGQKKKPALKDYEISKAIVETVMRTNGNTTISQIEGDIKEWLRRAGDRLRSLLNKQ